MNKLTTLTRSCNSVHLQFFFGESLSLICGMSVVYLVLDALIFLVFFRTEFVRDWSSHGTVFIVRGS